MPFLLVRGVAIGYPRCETSSKPNPPVMISAVLVLACLAFLYGRIAISKFGRGNIVSLVLAAYAVRIVFHFVTRNVNLFTNASGDSGFYEYLAQLVSDIWTRKGIHLVTKDELWTIGSASLPVNIFALAVHLNGGPATLGCTAICAASAALTGYEFYVLAREFEVPEKAAFFGTAAVLFSPAFVLYTSDTYKDALVTLFVFLALASSLRLVRSLQFRTIGVAIFSLVCLWYVRHYMVFATSLPLAVAVAGVGKKGIVRQVMVGLAALAAIALIVSTSNLLEDAQTAATRAFDTGTNKLVRDANSSLRQGSAVHFDDGGSVYGALHLKVLYTLFAPFPWTGGSIGLHLGKIDAGISVFFMVRAIKALRLHWQRYRARMIAILTFVVPTTFVYALGMANIGLITRQRIPVVLAIMLLGLLSYIPKTSEVQATQDDPTPEPARPRMRQRGVRVSRVPARGRSREELAARQQDARQVVALRYPKTQR
jgi:hypothetical protein